MSATGFILRVFIAVTLFVGVNAAINDAYVRGYEKRVAEQEATDKWVAQQMADVGFCAWFEQSAMVTECSVRKRAKK